MTLTTEQLDALEARAKAYDAAIAELDAVYEADCHMDRGQAERNAENARDEARDQLTSAVAPHVLHLVSVYRAALAWTTASREAAALRSRWAHTNDDTLLPEIDRLAKVIVESRLAMDIALRDGP